MAVEGPIQENLPRIDMSKCTTPESITKHSDELIQEFEKVSTDQKITHVSAILKQFQAIEQTATMKPTLQKIVTTWNAQKTKLEAEARNHEIYGNKAATLMEMNALLEQIPGASVPPLQAISHQEIFDHLTKYYDTYTKDWAAFVSSLDKNGKLQDASKGLLEKIQEKIRACFDDHPFQSPALESFLETQRNEGRLMMVRSTGKEDTDKLANAGGNISEAGVFAEPEAISRAMGKVIASYHSVLSLSQRELAHDDIKAKPFIPVLVQTMIGETGKPTEKTTARDIPISGVAYTQEMFGSTPGLVQIQTAPGHNESIVRSLIPYDTFYVYEDGTHHDVLAKKLTRLRAEPLKGFIEEKNPSELALRAALAPPQLEKLQQICRLLHKKYGRPTDIEWVYDPAKDTFYIVQARPIVRGKPITPTYFDSKGMPNIKTLVAETVVSRGGTVTKITKREEVIFGQTLEEAFDSFMKLPDNVRAQVKAAIVQKQAAATSHPACTLREMGVACFRLESGDFSLPDNGIALCDPQQGRIFIATDKTQEACDRALSLGIKEGWYRHPIPGLESVQPIQYEKEVALAHLHTIFGDAKTITRIHTRKDLEANLEKLHAAEKDDAHKAYRSVAEFLKRVVFRTTTEIDVKKPFAVRERNALLLRNIVAIGNRFMLAPTHLERLHAAKRLEALITQPGNETLLGIDSFYEVQRDKKFLKKVQIKAIAWSQAEQLELEKIKALAASKVKVTEEPLTDEDKENIAVLYTAPEKYFLNPKRTAMWREFTGKLIGTDSRQVNRLFINLLETAIHAHIIEQWLNITFPAAMETAKNNTLEALAALEKANGELQKVLPRITEARARLENFRRREAEWADPANYDTLLEEFQEGEVQKGKVQNSVVKDLEEISELFFQTRETEHLIRSVFMRYLQDGFDVYDKAIKSMKGSPQYAGKTLQAQRFKAMLQGYLKIMEMWVNHIPDNTVRGWFNKVLGCDSNPKKFILNQIHKKFDPLKAQERDLRPSPEFSVSHAVINSGSERAVEWYGKAFPNMTLEDLFMLMHQNTLAAFITLHQEPILRELPLELHAIHTAIQDRIKREGVPGSSFLGASYTYPTVTLSYNIPLRYHSCTIEVTYDSKRGSAEIKTLILAHERLQMPKIVSHIISSSFMEGIELSRVPSYDAPKNELPYICKFSKEDLQPKNSEKVPVKIQAWAQIINDAMAATFSSDFRGALPKISSDILVKNTEMFICKESDSISKKQIYSYVLQEIYDAMLAKYNVAQQAQNELQIEACKKQLESYYIFLVDKRQTAGIVHILRQVEPSILDYIKKFDPKCWTRFFQYIDSACLQTKRAEEKAKNYQLAYYFIEKGLEQEARKYMNLLGIDVPARGKAVSEQTALAALDGEKFKLLAAFLSQMGLKQQYAQLYDEYVNLAGSIIPEGAEPLEERIGQAFLSVIQKRAALSPQIEAVMVNFFQHHPDILMKNRDMIIYNQDDNFDQKELMALLQKAIYDALVQKYNQAMIAKNVDQQQKYMNQLADYFKFFMDNHQDETMKQICATDEIFSLLPSLANSIPQFWPLFFQNILGSVDLNKFFNRCSKIITPLFQEQLYAEYAKQLGFIIPQEAEPLEERLGRAFLNTLQNSPSGLSSSIENEMFAFFSQHSDILMKYRDMTIYKETDPELKISQMAHLQTAVYNVLVQKYNQAMTANNVAQQQEYMKPLADYFMFLLQNNQIETIAQLLGSEETFSQLDDFAKSNQQFWPLFFQRDLSRLCAVDFENVPLFNRLFQNCKTVDSQCKELMFAHLDVGKVIMHYSLEAFQALKSHWTQLKTRETLFHFLGNPKLRAEWQQNNWKNFQEIAKYLLDSWMEDQFRQLFQVIGINIPKQGGDLAEMAVTAFKNALLRRPSEVALLPAEFIYRNFMNIPPSEHAKWIYHPAMSLPVQRYYGLMQFYIYRQLYDTKKEEAAKYKQFLIDNGQTTVAQWDKWAKGSI